MKVKELIAELQKHDPEMHVFLYSGMDEGDAPIHSVQEVGTHFYCKGDSIIEAFLHAYKGERALVLHDEYDYATTDKEFYNKLEFPKEDTNDR